MLSLSLIRLYELTFSPCYCPLTTLIPNPSIKLRNSTLQLPPEIWIEIFQFATHVHREVTIVPLDPFSPRRVSTNVMATNCPLFALRTRLSLASVCRSWREIALPLLYRHVAIRSPFRASALLRVLRSSSLSGNIISRGYGYWTRHLEIYTHARGAQRPQFLRTLFCVLQHCPNLRILTGVWNHNLPIEFLNSISRLFGYSLQGLSWSEHHSPSPQLQERTPTSPQFFATFRNLLVLDLRNAMGGGSEHFIQEPVPPLPSVEELIISTHPQSLQMASAFVLPSLRNLTLRTLAQHHVPIEFVKRFLKVHGASLTAVDLPCPTQDLDSDLDYTSNNLRRRVDHVNPDLFLEEGACPNLVSIIYSVTAPVPTVVAHKSLRRIGLRAVRADALYPDKGTDTKTHLTAITSIRFPKLETVCTVGFLVEADMDGLLKDVFIWWVEKFEKLGIDFLDGEGVLWAYYEPEGDSRAERVDQPR